MQQRRRSKSVSALYAQLANVPPNVASLKFDPLTGAWEATFRPVVSPAAFSAPSDDEQPETDAEPEDFRFALERFNGMGSKKGAA